MTTKAITVAAVGLAAFAMPATAGAATLSLSPVKQCYHEREKLALGGSGYTPDQPVQVNSDGHYAGQVLAHADGTFLGALTLGRPNGETLKTFSAVDTANNANSASLPVRVSPLDATMPAQGKTGRPLRIRARGFTTGKTLYAHVVRGRFRRNLRIGRLKGACRKLSARKRIFSSRAGSGRYTVQFDTKRRYSKKTALSVRVPVTLYRLGAAQAAAQSWTRG